MTGSWIDILTLALGSSLEIKCVRCAAGSDGDGDDGDDGGDGDDDGPDLDWTRATMRGRCLGWRSIDGEVTTILADKILALRLDSKLSMIWIVLENRVVREVIVTMGMYRILSCRTPSLRLTVIDVVARRA